MKLFINTIDVIKQFVAVNASLAIETIKPYLIQAQRKFIVPVIGADLSNLLLDYYNDTKHVANELYDNLIEGIQEPLANYALYLYAPIGQLQVSDAGINRVETENNKAAYQYQMNELRKSWLDAAHQAIDELLGLLDATTSDTLPVWFSSAEYVENKSLFINSAEEFTNEVPNLNYSRRLFIYLKPIIRATEKRYILPSISAALFAEIKNELRANSVSDANKALLELIRLPVALLSMSKALDSLSIEIMPSSIVENYTSMMINEKSSVQASAAKIHNLERALEQDGKAELQRVIDFLNTNHADYPLFEASDLYVDVAAGEVVAEFVNDGGLFLM